MLAFKNSYLKYIAIYIKIRIQNIDNHYNNNNNFKLERCCHFGFTMQIYETSRHHSTLFILLYLYLSSVATATFHRYIRTDRRKWLYINNIEGSLPE